MGRPWCGCACGPVVLRCLVAHPLMGRHGGRRGRWVGYAIAVCPRRRCASWRVFPIPVCRAAGGRRPAVGPSPTIIYICIGVVNSALRGTLGPCPVAADGCFGGRCPAFCRYCRASGIQAWHKNSAPVATRAPAHCWFYGLAGGSPLPPPSAFIQAARHRACRWPRWRGRASGGWCIAC